MVAPHSFPDIDAAKRAARQRALTARVACDPSWGEALAIHVISELMPPADAVVAGYWPMPGEIDIRPLLHALCARGHTVLLPETPPRGNPLIFRHWHPGAAMLRERFGTMRPAGDIGVPHMLFMPLVAFDRMGRRLGYGGGYYDRTLAALPGVRAIGCAFAAQELDVVPEGEHDARLDAVVTEHGVIRFKDL